MHQVYVCNIVRDTLDGCGSSRATKIHVALLVKVWYILRSGVNDRAMWWIKLFGHLC